MAASSPTVLEMKEKYEKNKGSITNIKLKKDTITETNKMTHPYSNSICETEKNNPKEHDWIDKLVNDVDQLNKDNNTMTVKKKNPQETKEYTSNETTFTS